MDEKRIVRSVSNSLSRLSETKSEVASSLDVKVVSKHAKDLSNPSSPSAAMKKVGIALIVATPDPVTAVPGVALIATSYAIKSRSPAKLEDLAMETKKILRDIQSLSL